jgi:hypothetical protein
MVPSPSKVPSEINVKVPTVYSSPTAEQQSARVFDFDKLCLGERQEAFQLAGQILELPKILPGTNTLAYFYKSKSGKKVS